MPRLRLGTRGSRLAMAQAHAVSKLLVALKPDQDIEIVTIKTSGDRGDRDGLGVFVREIQEALLSETVDIGLHCLKDLPTEPVPGLRISACLEREDARDALIGHMNSVQALPPNALVGSGSVRRTAQLAAVRPDLKFKPLIGNVDTRLRKLMEGEYDAIILAIAGLSRLGVLANWRESEYGKLIVSPLDVGEMTPAPGQAVLALETRESDTPSHDWASKLNHLETETCAVAERAFLRGFGGGCSVPVGAFAQISGEDATFCGLVASPDGRTVLRESVETEPDFLLAASKLMVGEFLGKGARELYEAVTP